MSNGAELTFVYTEAGQPAREVSIDVLALRANGRNARGYLTINAVSGGGPQTFYLSQMSEVRLSLRTRKDAA
jgi:hypothetical protein